MENFMVEFWNDFDINLRKGYVTFFVLALTLMPFAKYLSEIYLECGNALCNANDLLFMKNLLIGFVLYVFIMIIVIFGHVMKFMMVGEQKPEIKKETKTVEEVKKEADLSEYEERIHRLW